MASTARLHTYFRSSCSYRVRIALHHKKIPFESLPVNLVKGEQKSEEYARKNPLKMVPVLEIDDLVLTQSCAIIEYLDETQPTSTPLLPKENPQLRAEIRRMAYIFAMDTQPIQNLPVLQHVKRLGSSPEEWAQQYIDRGFTAAESLVADEAKFLVGKDLSLADICFIPQVYNAQRFGVDMLNYPKLKKVADHLLTLESVKKAHPHNQPDCPDDLLGKF